MSLFGPIHAAWMVNVIKSVATRILKMNPYVDGFLFSRGLVDRDEEYLTCLQEEGIAMSLFLRQFLDAALARF
jgi:hypothetical protein